MAFSGRCAGCVLRGASPRPGFRTRHGVSDRSGLVMLARRLCDEGERSDPVDHLLKNSRAIRSIPRHERFIVARSGGTNARVSIRSPRRSVLNHHHSRSAPPVARLRGLRGVTLTRRRRGRRVRIPVPRRGTLAIRRPWAPIGSDGTSRRPRRRDSLGWFWSARGAINSIAPPTSCPLTYEACHRVPVAGNSSSSARQRRKFRGVYVIGPASDPHSLLGSAL